MIFDKLARSSKLIEGLRRVSLVRNGIRNSKTISVSSSKVFRCNDSCSGIQDAPEPLDKIRELFLRIGAFLFPPTVNFFSPDGDIADLTASNFDAFVRRHKKVFVMWYDPLCPACKRASVYFYELYEKFGSQLTFASVDGSENKELLEQHDIKAFPTFRLYDCNGGCSFKSHVGVLSLSEMREFINIFSSVEGSICSPNSTLWETKDSFLGRKNLLCFENIPIVNQTLRGLSTSAPQLNNKKVKVGQTVISLNDNVVELNSRNFHEKLTQIEQSLVYFYTSWSVQCGPSLKKFIDSAKHIKPPLGVLAICNAEESLDIVDTFYVKKIPTLKYFKKGKYVTDFIGEIQEDNLAKFMKQSNADEKYYNLVTKHEPSGTSNEDDGFTPTPKKKILEEVDGANLVIEITNSNLETVLKKNKSLLVLFYTCWNRICVNLINDFVRVANMVDRSHVVLAACDCEENIIPADRFNITSFPTLKYFKDGQVVRVFAGDYNFDSIMKFLEDPTKLQKVTERRMTVQQTHDGGVPDYWKGIQGGDKVLHFTDFNYKKLLSENPKVFLMFYVTWCRSCTPIKRELGKAAIALNKNVGVIGACDAGGNNEVADVFYIVKFPTLKLLKDGVSFMDYRGKRTAEDFMAFIQNPVETHNVVAAPRM